MLRHRTSSLLAGTGRLVSPFFFSRPAAGLNAPARWRAQPTVSPSSAFHREPTPRAPPAQPREPSPVTEVAAVDSPRWAMGAGIGAVSGFLGASAGVGGAVFSIPMLNRFAGIPQRVAAGTALFAVSTVAVSGSCVFYNAHQVDIPAAVCLSLSAACVAPLGVFASRAVSCEGLRRALGLFLLSVVPLMALRGSLEEHIEQSSTESGVDHDYSLGDDHKLLLLGTGASVGFISGLLGVGGGTLFTPAIAFLAGNDYADFHTVLGTSFLSMTLPAVIGALTYWRMGHVNLQLVPALCGGTLVGATAGSRFALAVPDEVLRWGFAVMFGCLGLRLLKPAQFFRRILSTARR